jgi:hypothetical protein
MIGKKTLQNVVMENWDNIAKTLDLNIENKPENMLLMLSHLRPILDSAAAAFPRPTIGMYHSIEDKYKKHILTLEKMGFVKREYENCYGLTSIGVDLMNCYHKQINPDYLTDRELVDKIIKQSDHLY